MHVYKGVENVCISAYQKKKKQQKSKHRSYINLEIPFQYYFMKLLAYNFVSTYTDKAVAEFWIFSPSSRFLSVFVESIQLFRCLWNMRFNYLKYYFKKKKSWEGSRKFF